MQLDSAPENTFLNEIQPFQEKKKKRKPRKLTNTSSHIAANRQDGAHELPEAQIQKDKCSRDAENGHLKAEEN